MLWDLDNDVLTEALSIFNEVALDKVTLICYIIYLETYILYI